MSCRKHSLAQLCPRPADFDAAVDWWVSRMGRWLVCEHCGQIGYRMRGRGRMFWIEDAETIERLNAKAEELTTARATDS